MSKRTIAVLGLGPMGAPIARNLLAAGETVTVWNRTISTAEPFAALGAAVASTPAEAAADVILSVLPDVDHLRNLLDPDTLAAWGSAEARLVIMSTTAPAKVRQLSADLALRGITVVDAPMSGGDEGARDGSMSIMAGCSAEEFDALLPIFNHIGGTIRRMGPLGAGSMAKLCNQVVVGGTLTALAEAFALAERAQLNTTYLAEIFAGGLAGSAALEVKGAKMLNHEYALGGSALNQFKDLRYARQSAAELGFHGELTPLLENLYSRLVERGDGELDHAAVLELFRE